MVSVDTTAALGGRLLERVDELESLQDVLEQVVAGEGGRLVFVSGEAGVGKTALLRQLCEQQSDPVRIAHGACEQLFTPRALGPFLDVAEQVGGDLASLAAGGARPHEFVAALLRELRSHGPSLLVLEDLHWLDEGTFDVLRLLAPRLGEVPTLVVASFRDDELGPGHQLQLLLGELAGDVGRIRLRPLSPDAVRELAWQVGADEEELYAKTAGNPFFVTEVLASGDAHIPDTVRDAVLARAVRLPLRARRMLEAAAVVPGRIELWLLEALLDGDLEPLTPALGSGMLHAEQGSVAFRHELARLAIEESIAPDRRLALHRGVLHALVQRRGATPDPARLAHHSEAAGEADAVLEHAPNAAMRAASLGAHREAAEQYERALRFADRLPPAQQAWLYERLAYEYHLMAQLDRAIDAATEALDRHRELDRPLAQGSALRILTKPLWLVGRTEEAHAAGREAIDLLEAAEEGPELALAYATMANIGLLEHDAPAVSEWGGKAVALAEWIDADDTLASAYSSMGRIACSSGDADGLAILERSLEHARLAGVDEHIARAYVNLAEAAVEMGRHGTADRYVAEGLAYTADRDLESYEGLLRASAARLELDRGCLARAAALAEAILRGPHTLPVVRVAALVVRGRALARLGEPGAWEPLDDALELCGPADIGLVGVGAARAEAAWLEGSVGTVEEETRAALELGIERGEAWLTAELAYWRWKAGSSDEVALVGASPFTLQLAGDWRAAAARWAANGCPYEAALALSDADDPDRLEDALAAFQELGVTPASRYVGRRLRELGIRRVSRGPRKATRENPAFLTARELDVLALLDDGFTNAAIADRLFVTPKTVDHHVSAILRKLGVHSRRDAVAEARRRGVGAA